MKIGINASFARKENTGIGQVALNFIRKLSELSMLNSQISNLEFVVYLEEDLLKSIKFPKNFTQRFFLPWWKRDDLIRKIWWEKFLLPKKVKQDQCDVLVSLYQSPTIMPGNVKHIMVVHDIIPELFPEYLNNSRKKIYWNLTEKAIRKADKIIAISSRTEKDLIQHLGIDPEKITVSYLDVDPIYKEKVSTEASAKALKKYKLEPGYFYCGGGLEARKNIPVLLKAYQILKESNKRNKFVSSFPRLVISGKLMPELSPLITDAESLIKEMNLNQEVELLDFVPQKFLPALYKNALAFIYPSLYEGFGLPILEAMSQGAPVIASKKSSLPEVGRDAVLYFNPENPEDLAMVMKNVLLNKKIREALSSRGKNRSEFFSWEMFVEKTLNLSREKRLD